MQQPHSAGSSQQFGPRVSVAGARRQLEQSFVTTATAARPALSQTTVNQLAERLSNALDIQNDLNGLGILTLSGSGSEASGLSLDFSTVNRVMCVTHGTVLHASATIMELNRQMRGVGNTAFVNFTTQLVHEWAWMAKVEGWLHQWSGSLVLSVVLGILGLGLCVWILCRFCCQYQNQMSVTKQAALAMAVQPECTHVSFLLGCLIDSGFVLTPVCLS